VLSKDYLLLGFLLQLLRLVQSRLLLMGCSLVFSVDCRLLFNLAARTVVQVKR
jgi:hypothetical protein